MLPLTRAERRTDGTRTRVWQKQISEWSVTRRIRGPSKQRGIRCSISCFNGAHSRFHRFLGRSVGCVPEAQLSREVQSLSKQTRSSTLRGACRRCHFHRCFRVGRYFLNRRFQTWLTTFWKFFYELNESGLDVSLKTPGDKLAYGLCRR